MGSWSLHPSQRVATYRARDWWTDETIDEVFRDRVAVDPERLAVVDPPNKADLVDSPSRRLSWSELDDAVDRMAGALLDLGLAPGDVLGVQLPNTVELVVAYLAAWRVGLIVSPLPVAYRQHEFRMLAERAGMTAMLTAPRIGQRHPAAEVQEVRDELPALRHVLAWGSAPGVDLDLSTHQPPADVAARVRAHQQAHPADPNHCMTICWTSGTTAVPKGVPRCHFDWIAISRATIAAPRLDADDVLLNPFPMVNMAGINGMFLPWLRVGGVLVQHHPFDLPTFLAQLQDERATYTVAPPALLSMLLANPDVLADVDLSSLRAIGSGSAPLPPSMVEGWQERHGIGVINFFGSNEGIALLSTPTDVPDPRERARYFPNYSAPGITWDIPVAASTEVRLVDTATGRDVTSPGEPGELHITGPTVFAGYLPGDDVVSPFDDEGWLATGDVFRTVGDDQRYLEFVDRAKDLVIRGGMNIAPAELEALLVTHPAIAEVAIVGLPDDVLGERVCAIVVPAPGATPTLEDVVAHLRELDVASYKLPERVEVVSELPRNPVGKVLKRELRDQYVPETPPGD